MLERASPARSFSFFHENVLGTSLDLQIEAGTESQARTAEERALCEIDRLEPVFSRYDARSEFRRWQDNLDIAIPLSQELFHVLEKCDTWKKISRGAFDPAGEAFLELWRAAAKKGHVPSETEIGRLRTQTAMPAWELNPSSRTAIRRGDYPLSLNSVAKGYIIDAVCETVLQSNGVRAAVVNIGGDLRVAGKHARRVGISDPFQDAENAKPAAIIELRNTALATSGDGRRGFEIDGKWYSHIIDPRTGRPAARFCSASVFAPDTMTADILATVFSIWSPGESIALADKTTGVGCFLIEPDGTSHFSGRWQFHTARHNPV